MTDRTQQHIADTAAPALPAEVAAPPLPADVVVWLLAADEPAVRFATLTELLGEPPDAPEAAAARRAIMSEGAVPQILAAQGDDGHWKGRDRFYTAKYPGDGVAADRPRRTRRRRRRRARAPRLRGGAPRLPGPHLGRLLDRALQEGRRRTPRHRHPLSHRRLVFSLIRLGTLDDPRVQAGVDWLTTYARFDDGDGEAPTDWPYVPAEPCWGRHPATWERSRRSSAARYRRSAARPRAAHSRRGRGVHGQASRAQAQPRPDEDLEARLEAPGIPAMIRPTCPRPRDPRGARAPGRPAGVRSAGPRRLQGRCPRPLEARGHADR